MAVVLTIAGTPQLYVVGSLNITYTVNGRATASFDVRSNDGTYRPAMDDEVVITEDATTIFGGLIKTVSEAGVLGDATGAYEAIVTRCSAVDYNAYAERRWVLKGGGFPDGYTLKQRLTSLLGYLTSYGVTLDAGQVDGPTLPEQIYEYWQVSNILTDTATVTGKFGDPYIWNIDNAKVLSAVQPSTVAAPFDITDGDKNTFGDLTVEETRDQYANRIIVRIPAQKQENRIETFTGDGSTTAFTLQYTPTKFYGTVGTTSNPYETLTDTSYPGTATWTYNPVDNTITRSSAPILGDTVSIQFDGVFTGEATAEDAGEIAAEGLTERVVTVESVPADETAQTLADAYLAKALPIPKTIKYKTKRSGLFPGMTQSITSTMRNLTVTDGTISDVVISDYGTGKLTRTVTVKDSVANQDGYRDVVRGWNGDKIGKSVIPSPVSVGTGVAVGGVAAPPVRSVQFNRNNAFGGNAAFIFYDTQASLVCGNGGSDITAAAFDSCYVLGNNCYITD